MSSQNAPTSSKHDRDNSVRALEERCRRRKQEEITRLRRTLNLIPRQTFNQFLEYMGDAPRFNSGQLVEWQLINISTQALEYYFNQSENQRRETVELSSIVKSLQKTVNDQAIRIAQIQQSNMNPSGSYGQPYVYDTRNNCPGGYQGM